MTYVRNSRVRISPGLLALPGCGTGSGRRARKECRPHIELDVAKATQPVDRFFDLSAGSDYPGTLIRDDSQAQLKTAVDELGFRYIRFHAILDDVLNTVQSKDGKVVYDWTKIDDLHDILGRRVPSRIGPLVLVLS